jgi:hypothetical protein
MSDEVSYKEIKELMDKYVDRVDFSHTQHAKVQSNLMGDLKLIVQESRGIASDNQKKISAIQTTLAVFTEKHKGYDKWAKAIGSVVMAITISSLLWIGSLIVGDK